MIGVVACTPVNPTALQIGAMDRETVSVPKQCERFYDNEKQVVAVVEYANNTTYKDARVVSGKSAGATAWGNRGVASFSSFDQVSKDLAPQLGEFAQGAVESLLVSMGGVDVVARAQMAKILKEQQFQMTLADPNTAVNFGMLSGAQFIITGSVDNINVSYTKPVDAPNVGGDGSKGGTMLSIMATVGSAAYNALAAGWNVEAEMTTNIIDVSTGRITSTKRTKATENIGDSPMFSMDQVIAGAKAAMGKAVKQSLDELSTQFAVNGYINELRGNKQVALINIGSSDGLKAKDRFQVFEMTVQRDFKSGNEKCTLTALPFELVVTPYVQSDNAWVSIGTTKPDDLSKIKVGSIVRRMAVKR